MAGHKSSPPERKPGWPDSDDDVINKYGTYEVQDTADTDNRYPMIAQGMPTQMTDTFQDSHPSRNDRKRREEGRVRRAPGRI